MGVGKATSEKKYMEEAVEAMKTIAGQKPVVTLSRLSIAGFKLREGQAIGCKVTLRGKRMYEFLDRLISFALPRVRDFRGLDPERLRRPRQLHPGPDRAIGFPRIEPGQVHPDPRHERDAGDQRRQRRRGAGVVAEAGDAVAGGVVRIVDVVVRPTPLSG